MRIIFKDETKKEYTPIEMQFTTDNTMVSFWIDVDNLKEFKKPDFTISSIELLNALVELKCAGDL